MPAISVVRGARAFCRHHGCAERVLGSALLSKRRTVMGLLDALEHETADTDFRLPGIDLFGVEDSVRIVIAKFVTQFVSAFWNRTDSAPFTVAHFENFIHQILCDTV